MRPVLFLVGVALISEFLRQTAELATLRSVSPPADLTADHQDVTLARANIQFVI